MKIRSLMTLCVLAAAGTALGTESKEVVSATQTCAAMAVPLSGTYTLISVPFKTVNGENSTVKVSELVYTTGLSEESCLFYYADGKYYTWKLQSGSWVPVAVTRKVDGKDVTTSTPSDDFALPCGATLWLERKGSEAQVYLYGQDGVTITPSVTANNLTLLSNPNATNYTFSAAGTASDLIMIPADNGSMTTYFYNGTEWGQWTTEKQTVGGKERSVRVFDNTKKPVIPGGRGAWYASKGETVPSFQW